MAKKVTAKKPKIDGDKKTGAASKAMTFDALRVQQGKGGSLYVFVAKASVLYELVSINRREADKDIGYQRVLSHSRTDAVRKFVMQGNSLPGCIVVSFDKATYDDKLGQLTIPRGTDVGWVIDGQHRLVGSMLAARENTDIDLAAIAFVGLNEQKQVFQFITINKEAKNVPSSLYLDLLRKLPPAKDVGTMAKERAADIALALRANDESPFFERIELGTMARPGTISLANFVRKVAPFVNPKKGLLLGYPAGEQVKIFNNYFTGLARVHPDAAESPSGILFKTVGFGALLNVFHQFFTTTIRAQGGFEARDVGIIWERISSSVFDEFGQYGSGSQAEGNAADELRIALEQAWPSNASPSSIRL